MTIFTIMAFIANTQLIRSYDFITDELDQLMDFMQREFKAFYHGDKFNDFTDAVEVYTYMMRDYKENLENADLDEISTAAWVVNNLNEIKSVVYEAANAFNALLNK